MKKMKTPRPFDIAQAMGAEALMVEPRAWQQFCAAGGFGAYEFEDRETPETPNVAVIGIHGMLVARGPAWMSYFGVMSYETIRSQVQAALDDPSVSAIVLDFDSFGGAVPGVFATADFIAEAEKVKPIVSVANEKMASAAYALAAPSSKILAASKTAKLGSIGIIAVHVDTSEAEKKVGLKFTEIFAGKRKVDASQHRPLSADDKARIQSSVDETYDLFVTHVAKHRRISEDEVRGQEAATFSAVAAQANGLSDRMGSLEDAIALAAELGARRKAKPSSVRTPSAAASAPVISTEKETVDMNEPTNPQPKADAGSQSASPGTATVVNMDEITANAQKAAEESMHARNVEINALCKLARRPEKASEFMASKLTVEQVREELLKLDANEDAKAPTSSARSNLGPEAQAKEAMALVDDMKARCTAMATSGKGI